MDAAIVVQSVGDWVHRGSRRSRLRVLDPPDFDFLEADAGGAADDRFLDAAGSAGAAADAPSAAAAGTDARLADLGFAADALGAAEALGATGAEARNNSCLKSS